MFTTRLWWNTPLYEHLSSTQGSADSGLSQGVMSDSGSESHDDPKSEAQDWLHDRKPRRCKRVLHIGVMVIFAILASWGAIDICLRVFRLAFPLKIHDRDYLTNYCVRTCGGTQAEALSRGCLYDHIENRFTRPDCVNPLLNDEFSRLGPGNNGSWIYQVDVQGDGTLTPMESAEMLESVRPGLRVWQTARQHTLHCLFVWRRNALSHFDGTIITMDKKELFEHDAHCARMITNRLAGDDLEQYVTVTTYGPLDQEAKDRAEKFFAEQAERLRTGNGVVAPIFNGDVTRRLI